MSRVHDEFEQFLEIIGVELYQYQLEVCKMLIDNIENEKSVVLASVGRNGFKTTSNKLASEFYKERCNND